MSGPGRYSGQFRPEFSRLHLDRDLLWVVPVSVRYIVGVTGLRFAGKSAALAHLSEKRGFEVYSLAGELRRVAGNHGIPLTPRSRLQDFGDELRAEHRDPAYLARLLLRRIHRDHLDQRGRLDPPARIAVGGFKRFEEVDVFARAVNFQQLEVASDIESRHLRAVRSGVQERELEHMGLAEPCSLQSFRDHVDARDLDGDTLPTASRWTRGYGQDVKRVSASPGKLEVMNDLTVAELGAKLDDSVSKLDRRFPASSG